jgi:hypothetical protein
MLCIEIIFCFRKDSPVIIYNHSAVFLFLKPKIKSLFARINIQCSDYGAVLQEYVSLV